MKPITIEGVSLAPVFVVTEESPFDPALVTGQLALVLDKVGWLVYNRGPVSEGLVRTALAPLTGEAKTFLRPTKKIPAAILRQSVAFFRAVYKEHRAEAVLYLYYHPETNEWDVEPPEQEVDYSSTKHGAPQLVAGSGWVVAGTIHSHGGMPAFHSGTDDKDEEFRYGIHVTVGNVDGSVSFACSLVFQGKREKVEVDDLFDGLQLTSQFPADWLARVSKRSYNGAVTYHGHGVTAHTYDDDKVDCHVSRRDQRPAKGNGKAGDDTARHVGFHSR